MDNVPSAAKASVLGTEDQDSVSLFESRVEANYNGSHVSDGQREEISISLCLH